jgi:Metallo-peptidase family M12B Reprolysin-like
MNDCRLLTFFKLLFCMLTSMLSTSILCGEDIKADALTLWSKSIRDAKIVPSPQAASKYLSIELNNSNIEKLWDEKLASVRTPYSIILPDGKTVNAYTEEPPEKLRNGFVWHGRLEEDGERSNITLSVVNNTLFGEILRSNGQLFRVRFAEDGLHVIEEIAANKFGPGTRPIEVKVRSPNSPKKKKRRIVQPKAGFYDPPGYSDTNFIRTSTTRTSTCADSAEKIDILVVYTPKAKSTAGGDNAIQSMINLAIRETNDSYRNSLVSQRINLVEAREVPYSGNESVAFAIEPLTRKSDSVMDEIHLWRDELRADIVVLLTDNENNSSCGIAHQMRFLSPTHEEFAFAAVPLSCATGQFNFAHELGHIMGADEDWASSGSVLPFRYSHGLTNPDPNDPWRTVMAENTACAAVPGTASRPPGCVRLPFWSNPSLRRGVRDMGISQGPNQANNSKTLNNTANVVANFRRACD